MWLGESVAIHNLGERGGGGGGEEGRGRKRRGEEEKKKGGGGREEGRRRRRREEALNMDAVSLAMPCTLPYLGLHLTAAEAGIGN